MKKLLLMLIFILPLISAISWSGGGSSGGDGAYDYNHTIEANKSIWLTYSNDFLSTFNATYDALRIWGYNQTLAVVNDFNYNETLLAYDYTNTATTNLASNISAINSSSVHLMGTDNIYGTKNWYGEQYFYNNTFLTTIQGNVVNGSLLITNLDKTTLFVVNTSSPDQKLVMNGNSLIAGMLNVTGIVAPTSGGSYSLGTDGKRWTAGYFGTDVYITGVTGGVKQWVYNQSLSPTITQWLYNTSLLPYGNWTGNSTAIWSKTNKVYVTRAGAISESLSIGVDDEDVFFESIQNENTGANGNMIFRIDDDSTAATFFSFGGKSASEYLRITNTGKVGIGTTTPNLALNVTGSIGISEGLYVEKTANLNHTVFISNSKIGILTESPDTTLDVHGETIINSSATTGSFQVYNTSRTNHFFINGTNGRIGIGTTTPSHKFNVIGGGNFTDILIVQGTLYIGGGIQCLGTYNIDVPGDCNSGDFVIGVVSIGTSSATIKCCDVHV